MQFTLQREQLLQPLNQVIGVVERRQTLPVLANTLLVADDAGLWFTASDLEVEMRAHLKAQVDEGGEVTLPARKLYDICRALPEEVAITLSRHEDRVNLKAGRSRFTLATLPASEFPQIEDVDAETSVALPQDGLRELIERTAFAMAHQDVRYYLNGLLLELSEATVRCVATDGHRLAVADMDNSSEKSKVLSQTIQIIIPRKGVLELQRLLDSDDEITLELSKNHVRLKRDDVMFTSKLIDGRFPDYQAVIPENMQSRIEIERAPFREALHRAAILSNEKVGGVKLDVKKNALTVIAHNLEQEEAVEELEVQYDGDELGVGFNVQYLQEALGALNDDEVYLFLRDANSSCLIRDKSSERNRHVVMPLRL